jgi:phage-related protein/predicted XRE-type DNA-binding protein
MEGEKSLEWTGAGKRDLLDFPDQAHRAVGYALGVAQLGAKHPAAKPWKGEGTGVLEVVEANDGNAYRAVYTVRFAKAVYVRRCFQKKSPSGLKPPRSITRNTMAKPTATTVQAIPIQPSSGNVFADLGLAEPEELKTKLVLAMRLNERIKALGLKQADLAKRLGIAQPNVSALQNYRLDNFSSEKLLEFFNALGYDVDLLIRPAPGTRRGAMQVLMAA